MATVIRAVTAFSVSRCIAPRSRTTHQPSRVLTPLAVAALKAAGCERLYAEKRSDAETDLKALAKLLKEASPSDTVVVTRLDRLARSTRDLLNLLVRLGKDNIGFKSLRETSVDTTSPQGRLVVNILASISEFERELIHARMTEGRKRAVANGVKFGPKFKLNSFQRQEALARLAVGEGSQLSQRHMALTPLRSRACKERRLAPTRAVRGYPPTGEQRARNHGRS